MAECTKPMVKDPDGYLLLGKLGRSVNFGEDQFLEDYES